MQQKDGSTAGHGRDRVIDDVADALTLNQKVQWERCEELATPANRRSLDNLRALARVGTSREGEEAASAAGSPPRAGAFARRATQALVAIAAVEVAVALVLLPWAWGDFRREHGEFASYMATQLVGHAASACLLLLAGRRDPRTWLLGVYCLLKATLASYYMTPAFLLEMPPPAEGVAEAPDAVPASIRLYLYLYVPAFVFAPAFLWAFARECPRVHRRAWLDDLARRMVPVSVAFGVGVCVVGGAALEFARAGWEAVPFSLVLDSSIAALDLLAFAAVVVVVLRAHTAAAREVRRVVVFAAGFLLYMGISGALDVAEVFLPGGWAANYRWSPTILVMELLRFPGMVLLWYSVLAVRVPHMREVVRGCFRWLLARPGLLGAASAAPALGLIWLVARRPERAVGAVLTDPLAQSLFAATTLLLLLILGRRQLLRRVDAWVYPETTDQRQALAEVASRLAQAGSVRTVSRLVARAARRGSGSTATLFAAATSGTHEAAYHPVEARGAPLLRATAIVHMLETVGGTLRVHPDDENSVFALLPHDEATWLLETATDAIVPVPGPGGDLLGVLVVGRRFDDRIVRPVDLPFLEALGAAAGLAIGRLRAMRPAGNSTPEALPANECPECGCVVETGGPPECDCGSAYVEAEVPRLLAGKFRLMRRLGRGAMGVVYLARDLQLERNVAVKSLTDISVLGLMGLRPEAWAMAELTHPAVVQIYGIESWRDRPFLVLEHLAGGTLADRLRRGPIAEPEAVAMTAALADALGALHGAGYLHGDVKPSNIGFTQDGMPKLLDFGLARETDSAGHAGGTPRYASPEVLSGQPADEADDVWSLCVVLYEMVSGEHPFAGDDIHEVTQRIRERRVGRPGQPVTGSGSPSAVTAFAAATLSDARWTRPATARAFADALNAAVGDQ